MKTRLLVIIEDGTWKRKTLRMIQAIVALRTFNNRIVGTMCAPSVSTVAKSMADKQIHAVLWKI